MLVQYKPASEADEISGAEEFAKQEPIDDEALLRALGEQWLSGKAIVHDGDTLIIKGQRLRLYGLDAPELQQFCKQGERLLACGMAAREALSEKLHGETTACKIKGDDAYGRGLAICFRDAENINEWLLLGGWAMVNPRYEQDFKPVEQAAQKAQRGIWNMEILPPWEWRRKASSALFFYLRILFWFEFIP